MTDWLIKIGTIASIALPLFNIPLIIRMIKRKSAEDISIEWVLGVWVCTALMMPAALVSQDIAFKAYGIVNMVFFSVVVFFVLKYRWFKGKN